MWGSDRGVLRHEFGDPLDEHAQLFADMPVRRKRDVQRHRRDAPVFEEHGQAGGEVGITVVDRQHMAALQVHALAVALDGIRKALPVREERKLTMR